jgi:mediator of RNA polymerase II transcription subunit 21
MADILTQLQTCLDQVRSPGIYSAAARTALILQQLATQYYASVCYNLSRHDLVPPAPNSDPYSFAPKEEPREEDTGAQVTRPLRPDSPTTFASNQVQLARDLIIKEQQIEYLIQVLPGIGTSEKEQTERIRSLEVELRQMQEQRKQRRKEMRATVKKLENVIMGVANSHGHGLDA